MSDQSPLIVALGVEAIVVNDQNRQLPAWLRTTMNYGLLFKGQNAAAAPVNTSQFSQPGTGSYYDGVYVKWRMPRTFARGRSSPAGVVYPAVPNRWLVVRTGGAGPTAWIVESDFPYAGGQPANYSAEPALYVTGGPGSTPSSVYMGRNVPLATSTWSEPGRANALTAQAPGNPAFLVYQPQNNNVFSFVDPLGAGGAGEGTYSYTVWGWFSSKEDDPLADPAGLAFADLLASLDWTLPAGTDPALTASWTLLCGTVSGVDWQTAALPPTTRPDGSHPVSVAIGNTSVEALTALIAAEASARGVEVDAALLEAFQLDAIGLLDEPDGVAQLADRIQASFFKKLSGGYRWSLDAVAGARSSPADHDAALATLNLDQAAFDAAAVALRAAQSQLYVAWWKQFSYAAASSGVTDPVVTKAQIDALVATLSTRVSEERAALAVLAAEVPQGETPQELTAAIAAYQAEHGIPTDLLLKREAAGNYFEPNEPVVLLAGAGASGIVQQTSSLARFPSQLVTGVAVEEGVTVTAATAGLTIPLPALSGATGVPWSSAAATAMLQESFLLDPANAQAIATAIGSSDPAAVRKAMLDPANARGCYPTGAMQPWTGNLWRPLFLFYGFLYQALPHDTAGTLNWTFDQGQYWLARNAETIAAAAPGPSGQLMLAPTAAMTMRARIVAFLDQSPGLPDDQRAAFETLLAFVDASGSGWDLMSQALNGFNDELKLAQPGLFLAPASDQPTLGDLIGDAATSPPALGNVPSAGDGSVSQFQPWRAGQMYLTELTLVDEWGQAIFPVTGQTRMIDRIYLPPEFQPVRTSSAADFHVGTGASIDALVPAILPAGTGSAQLTVLGSGFGSGSAVAVAGRTMPTTLVGPNQLDATIDLSGLSGSQPVTVVDGSVASAAVPLTITADPAIDTVAPPLAAAGSAVSDTTTLTITGVNFAADATAFWGSAPLATAYVAATTLTAALPASYLAAPGGVALTVRSAGSVTVAYTFAIVDGPAVTALSPASAMAGSAATTVTLTGTGFTAESTVVWTAEGGGAPVPLVTGYVDAGQLTAVVPASLLQSAGRAAMAESVGSSILPTLATSIVQLPPALLQPSRLEFGMVSATSDRMPYGPGDPGADPICGWVLPNHLDSAIMAYAPGGALLGELSLAVQADGGRAVAWNGAPGSAPLETIAGELPHFGPFLLALHGKTTAQFSDFLAAIDETLWTTQPMGAAFDDALAVLIGRPLAMVRSSLRLTLLGPPDTDPGWQFTNDPPRPAVLDYSFPVELGNVARLDDGLVGYFNADDYDAFNVVAQSGATDDGYIHPIGVDGNYLPLSFGAAEPSFVSMLVDPRAPVHATTGILPTATVQLPGGAVDAALATMTVTFRMSGVLTDQRLAVDDAGVTRTSVLMPLPSERSGAWSFVQPAGADATDLPAVRADATAALANVPPVLRQGLLRFAPAKGGRADADNASEK